MTSTHTPKTVETVAPLRLPPVHRWRDIALFAGLFGLVIAGLFGIAAATGWEETWTHIKNLAVWQVAILLLLSLVNYVMRGLRWHILVRRLGLDLNFSQNLRHFLGGFAMSVTPGRLGEFVRMRWIRRETGMPAEKTAPLMLMDRASDLAVMALLLAIGLLAAASGPRGAIPVAIVALVMAFVVTRPALLRFVVNGLYKTIGRKPRFFVRVRRASDSLAQFSHGPTMFMALILGGIGWFAEGTSFYYLMSWLGSDISLATCVVIFVFSTLAGGLTGAPGGVGGAEAAMIALLSLEGIPLSMSIPATAVIRLTTLWFAIAIGFVIFPIAEKYSKRGAYALEV
ncbi:MULTISPECIES: lysylphosphatidylglycerol synthase transmembrane domain-containing protein [Falsihalocynthiibacter]|uniref:lysylphosphatidylglycerol synthase transmembrane domain-containing protein n=1 Tax=Falsihalocynthiibacter TaxID=2854182 RepID=UPI003002E6F3